LSSVVYANLSSARARARDAHRIAEMEQIETALGMYFVRNGEYPNDGCATTGRRPGCGCISFSVMAQEELVDKGFLPAVPEDPTHPDPCYQYQNNYNEKLCGGQILPSPNYYVLFRSETNLADDYRDWEGGVVPGAYSCLAPY